MWLIVFGVAPRQMYLVVVQKCANSERRGRNCAIIELVPEMSAGRQQYFSDAKVTRKKDSRILKLMKEQKGRAY